MAELAFKLSCLGRALKDLFFPANCLHCQAVAGGNIPFCASCAAAIKPLTGPACARCGRPWPVREEVPWCFFCSHMPPAFDQALAVAVHDGTLAQVLSQFKYQRRWGHGPALARFLGYKAPVLADMDNPLVMPVPLHRYRLIMRGFNQSLVLARGYAEINAFELLPAALIRLRYTRPQVGLPPKDRQKNVSGAFALNPRAVDGVKERNVLLIDDVFTTGATVNECASVLKKAGAAKVLVLTLTRALLTAFNK